MTLLPGMFEVPFWMEVKHHQLACKETLPIMLKTVLPYCEKQEMKTNNEPSVNGGALHRYESRHLLLLTNGLGVGDLGAI